PLPLGEGAAKRRVTADRTKCSVSPPSSGASRHLLPEGEGLAPHLFALYGTALVIDRRYSKRPTNDSQAILTVYWLNAKLPRSLQEGHRTDMAHVERRIEGGEVLSPQQLLQFPFFKGVSEKLLEKNLGAAVRREFKKGEIICREGDQGSTAFYILKGKVDIFIHSSVSQIQKEPEKKSWFNRMKSILVHPSPHSRTSSHEYIPIDAPVDLSLDNPIAELGEGDLFGEMT